MPGGTAILGCLLFSPVLSRGTISEIPGSSRKIVPNRRPIPCQVGQPFLAVRFFPESFVGAQYRRFRAAPENRAQPPSHRMLGGTAILGCPLFSQSFEGHDIGDSGQQPDNRAQPPSHRMPGGTAILGCPLFPQSFVGARYRRFRAAAGKPCPTAVPSHAGWDSHSWLSAFPQSFVLTFQRSNFCLPSVSSTPSSPATHHSPL